MYRVNGDLSLITYGIILKVTFFNVRSLKKGAEYNYSYSLSTSRIVYNNKSGWTKNTADIQISRILSWISIFG